MPPVVVSIAVLENDRVLLTKRDDFDIWCLPSGGVEWGESVAQAAVRETKEETGLDIQLIRLVGVYSRIGGLSDIHALHFTAKRLSGKLRSRPGETTEVKFFPIDHLPDEMVIGHPRRIADSLNPNLPAQAVSQKFSSEGVDPIEGREFLAMRDRSGLEPAQFYREFFADRWESEEIVEVG